MADDDTGAGEAQGAAAGEAQGAAPSAQGASDATAQGASDTSGGREAELLQKIAELEKDNYSYRQKSQQQPKPDKALQERVSELERELTAEKAQRQEQSLRLAAVTTATRLGYRNPDLAYRLLDTSSLDFDKDGTPRNVEKMLTDLAKAEPYLLAATDFGGGQRGGAGTGNDMNSLIRRAAGRPG